MYNDEFLGRAVIDGAERWAKIREVKEQALESEGEEDEMKEALVACYL